MQVSIRPIDIEGQTITTATVSVAATDSVAVRLVPTDGVTEWPDHAVGLVGVAGDTDADALLAAVAAAVQTFVTGRGV